MVRTRHQIHLKSSISPIEPRAGCVAWTDAPACMCERGAWRREGAGFVAVVRMVVERSRGVVVRMVVQRSPVQRSISVAMMSRIESVSSDHSVLLFEGTDSCSHIGKKLLQRFVDVLLVKHT